MTVDRNGTQVAILLDAFHVKDVVGYNLIRSFDKKAAFSKWQKLNKKPIFAGPGKHAMVHDNLSDSAENVFYCVEIMNQDGTISYSDFIETEKL